MIAAVLVGSLRDLLGRVFSLVNPIVAIAGIISTAGAGVLAASLLGGLHAQVLGVQLGTYDTIFSLAGVLILAGAIYAYRNLSRAPT